MKIAAAQFEPKDGDKTYNLSILRTLTEKAKSRGADVISFHEMCITAYTFTKDLNLNQLIDLAEEIPQGKSSQALIELAKELNIAILAGLLEKEKGQIYNSYVCATGDGIVAKHRKLHPFISEHLSPGGEYCVFDLLGWTCGILICYDNNVIENVRATCLLGADLIFAPHVTCCTPSAMPGRAYVDDAFWQNRHEDPVSLRREFDGPKGRQWLMKWLPSRAYDNGVYYVYANPIGYDGEQLKNGNSMIIDPFGDILTEIRSFENEIAMAEITKEKIQQAGGRRYRNARRPELYRDLIGAPHQSNTAPVWLKKDEE